LRLVFYTKDSGSSFNIQTESNPPRLIINTVKQGSTAPPPGPGAQVVSSSNVAQTKVAVAAPDTGATTASISNQVGFQLPQIPSPSRNRPSSTRGGKKYVFIDPGHGGANTGAKSHIQVNGQYVNEEDLTLQFAYELKKLVDANPNMVGLLTRVDNSNVGLTDRVKFAEDNADANGSSLFISIHMNDAPNTDAHGMEVYFLNEKGTVDAAVREKEKMENRDVGLGSRNNNSLLDNLLTSMQKDLLQDWQYESYILCRKIEQSLLTDRYFAQSNRGVKNANFVVLKNFKMPAVLLEVGFISNSDELRYLMNPQFQQQTAALVYNAMNAYFAENDSSYRPEYKAVAGQRR
jgi:N-acetylmuramoyl-L-alanine amidase